MSEFSESFHSYTGNSGSVITMLRRAGVSGLIAGSNEHCTSFVIDDPGREADVIAASQGVLARYHYGEDHGLWIKLHRDGEPLAAIALVWDVDAGSFGELDEEEKPQKVEPATQTAQKLARAGVLGDAEAIELCRVLEAFSPEDPGSRDRAVEAVPKLLGFAAYKWLSAAYVQSSSPEERRNLFPGAEVVDIG
jgi:hypothetical protein